MANCLRVIREARALHSDWPADEVERTDKLKTTFEFSGQRSQYSNWASDIIGYLEGRGVVHHLFVSDAAAPPGNDADLKARRVANRAAVVAYLRMCIKGEAKDDISSFRQEPRKIWEALENVYGSGSEAELATLQTQYDSFVMANGETMEHLYRRLGKLIREMADLGQVVDDATKRRTLLNSIVDRSWEHTVMRIREDSGNLTALQVFARLQGVEKQLIANEKKRELHAPSQNVGLFSATPKGDKGKREEKNKKKQQGTNLAGSSSSSSSSSGGASSKVKKDKECFHCGKTGHIVKDCNLKKSGGAQTAEGKKKWEAFLKQKEESYKKHFGLAAHTCEKSVEIVVDTGAQPSIVKDKSLLTNFSNKPSLIHQVDGSIQSKGSGDFMVDSNLPPLKNSILAPSSSYNLLSVGQMADEWDCSTIFSSDKFVTIQGQIRIPHEKVILSGVRSKGGLYKLERGENGEILKNVVLASEASERTTQKKQKLFSENGGLSASYLSDEQVIKTPNFFESSKNDGVFATNLTDHQVIKAPDLAPQIPANLDLVISKLKSDIVDEVISGLKDRFFMENPVQTKDEAKDNRPSPIELDSSEASISKPQEVVSVESQQLQQPAKKKKARAQRVFNHDDQMDYNTWHMRFGHLSSMESTIKAGAAYGIPRDMSMLKKPSGDACVDCIKGKQKRKQHASSDSKSKEKRNFKPGEKIHIDTKKFEVVGIGNYIHWLSIVDDASGAEIGAPLRGRSAAELLDVLDRKRKWLELKTGNKLQEIQCDGAREFVDGIADDKAWAGVTISSSSAYSPEENGRVERMNQTRSNTSLTLLSQSKLDKRFWPFSERMAALHINYTVPNKESRTRWEILTGVKPDYSNVHPFGCHAFCHVPKETRKALDPKSRPGIYLGESEKKSGVLLWDPKGRKVFESNSVLYDYKRFGAQDLLARFDGDAKIPQYFDAPVLVEDYFTKKDCAVVSNAQTNIFSPSQPPPQTGDQDDPVDVSHGHPADASVDPQDVQLSQSSSDPGSSAPRKRGRPKKDANAPSATTSDPKGKEEDDQEVRRSARNAGKPTPMYSQTFINRVNIEEEKGGDKVAKLPCEANVAEYEEYLQWRRGYDDDVLNYALMAKYEESDPSLPKSPAQALKDPECRASMKKEIDGFWEMKVWVLVPRPPPGPNVVVRRGVWGHRRKPKDGSLKSRYSFDGSDIVDTPENVYSGTPKSESVNLMCEISASLGIPLKSGDIPKAYLHAEMPESGTTYYVTQPPGFVNPEHPNHVLKLLRPMYGLPCAGRLWNRTWVTFACNSIGFVQMKSDPCIFKLTTEKGNVMYMLLFTDDDLSCCTSPKLEAKVFMELEKRFKYKNDGICTFFLGARMVQDFSGVRLLLDGFTKDLIGKFKDYNVKVRDTPGQSGLMLKEPSEPSSSDFPMGTLNGSLLWVSRTRPEICYAVGQSCKFTANFDQSHVEAGLHILGYLKKYPDYGLYFKSNPDYKKGDKFKVEIYVDSSFADDPVRRHSTYGYLIFVNGNLISWRSKLTPKVAHSSTEAEYIAMSEGGKAAEGIMNLIEELGFEIDYPVPLYVDNAGAKEWAANPMVTNRSKHIELRYHYIRELIASGRIEPRKISTVDISDITTKNLGRVLFWKHAKKLVHKC